MHICVNVDMSVCIYTYMLKFVSFLRSFFMSSLETITN